MPDTRTAAESLFREGLQFAQKGETAQGIQKWREAIQTDPLFAEPYGHLAWHYFNSSQYLPACRYLQKQLTLQPDNAEAHFYHSLALLHLSEPKKARKEFRTALKLLGENAPEKRLLWKQSWKEHKPYCRHTPWQDRLKQLHQKNPVFRIVFRAIRKALLKISWFLMDQYETFAWKKVLPRKLSEARHPVFSIGDYLRFLAIHGEVERRFFITYSRIAEAAVHCEAIRLKPGATVLDVGTGINPLPLYWASKGMRVTCTDPDDFIFRLVPLAEQMGLDEALRAGNLRIEVADGAQLPYPDNSFDFWTSVSVVEHIPQDGDAQVLREAARVLKPGGIAVLTTEGGLREEEVWYRTEGYFGKQYFECVTSTELKEIGMANTAENLESFEQQEQQHTFALLREYNRERLMKRLVEPSGLELVELGFIDSRFKKDFRGAFEICPRPWWAEVLEPFLPLITYFTYRRLDEASEENLTHASTAYVILRKPH